MYKHSLFIFRRDLRIVDNTALYEAMERSETVTPIFIIDTRQVQKNKNKYRSEAAVQFLIESLQDLSEEIDSKGGKLSFLYGIAEKEIEKLIKNEKVNAIFFNKDYTPFSQKRDNAIRKLEGKYDISVHFYDDTLLHPPGKVLKDDEDPYVVYSPFYKKAIQQKVSQVKKRQKNHFCKKYIKEHQRNWEKLFQLKKYNQNVILGGRKEGKKLLKRLNTIVDYSRLRDLPAEKGVSHLSAHHKFGTISIRETYWYAKKLWGIDCQFIKELFWRDFYYHIIFYYPYVLKRAFKEKYQNFPWSSDKKLFRLWCEGKTGFPIIDAGMRQLNQTGYMHNRVRMIVASFLVKDLHIDWRWGEKYFAQHLVDYDPAVNNGNWQWVASTGCDAQPYFRIFNPWLQQKRFDPQAEYIKKWVPELALVAIDEIHSLYKNNKNFFGYYQPIINHKKQTQIIKDLFKKYS